MLGRSPSSSFKQTRVGFGKFNLFIHNIHEYIIFGNVFFLANSSMFYIFRDIILVYRDMHSTYALCVDIYIIFKHHQFFIEKKQLIIYLSVD